MNDKTPSTKSRDAILDAFNRLILSSDGIDIRVSDIVRQADIGRSTFYEHFPNADSVFQEAISEPFWIFAKSSIEGDGERLADMLMHFSDNRVKAHALMADARTRDQMAGILTAHYERLLDQLEWQANKEQSAEVAIHERERAVEMRLPREHRLCAVHLAESNLALVRQWTSGKLKCDEQTLARFILRCTEQVVTLCRGV